MNSPLPQYQQLSADYFHIEKALIYLEEHFLEHPSLHEIASSIGFSESHFQRIFTRWVGISPKRFLQFLTKEHAKRLLERSESLLETAFQSGLTSPGRLHDLFVNCEAVTPGQYKNRGKDITIWYGFHKTPFGECLLALTERGLCGLSFVSRENNQQLIHDLSQRWNNARLVDAPDRTATLVNRIFPLTPEDLTTPLTIFLRGTNFQIKVWEALLRIPSSHLVTYENIATAVGSHKAVRAVGQAVGKNPVAVLIPCHRVIRKMGTFGGYRWGIPRKMALHGWEMARSEA